MHRQGWYAEHDIDLRRGTRVTGLDVAAHHVTVIGGDWIGYDKLLLATGSAVRRLSVPGAEFDGVFDLRSLAECEAIKAALRHRRAGGNHRGGAGSGWENAAAARAAGREITVIERAERPGCSRCSAASWAKIYAAGTGTRLMLRLAPAFAEMHRYGSAAPPGGAWTTAASSTPTRSWSAWASPPTALSTCLRSMGIARWGRFGCSRGARFRGGFRRTGDVVPGGEAVGHLGGDNRSAVRRWRRGRKCGGVTLNTARNRWAAPGVRKRSMGAFALPGRLVRVLPPGCSGTSTAGARPTPSRRCATDSFGATGDQHPRRRCTPLQELRKNGLAALASRRG